MPAVVSRGRGRRTISEINMVPFIDVMLVLLIIFMVTAPLIAPSMIDLPSVGKAAKQPDQIVQIVIGKDESLELKTGDKPASSRSAKWPLPSRPCRAARPTPLWSSAPTAV
jgi:biopolymer transport protein TolR